MFCSRFRSGICTHNNNNNTNQINNTIIWAREGSPAQEQGVAGTHRATSACHCHHCNKCACVCLFQGQGWVGQGGAGQGRATNHLQGGKGAGRGGARLGGAQSPPSPLHKCQQQCSKVNRRVPGALPQGSGASPSNKGGRGRSRLAGKSPLSVGNACGVGARQGWGNWGLTPTRARGTTNRQQGGGKGKANR